MQDHATSRTRQALSSACSHPDLVPHVGLLLRSQAFTTTPDIEVAHMTCDYDA